MTKPKPSSTFNRHASRIRIVRAEPRAFLALGFGFKLVTVPSDKSPFAQVKLIRTASGNSRH